MSKNKLHYFGTKLDYAGHYFWDITEHGINSSKIVFGDTPFNPEEMPRSNRHLKPHDRPLGVVDFYHEHGFTICAIEGSCYDKRPGSKSVFWVEEYLQPPEMIERILSYPSAKAIIDSMPFAVKEFNHEKPHNNGN